MVYWIRRDTVSYIPFQTKLFLFELFLILLFKFFDLIYYLKNFDGSQYIAVKEHSQVYGSV